MILSPHSSAAGGRGIVNYRPLRGQKHCDGILIVDIVDAKITPAATREDLHGEES